MILAPDVIEAARSLQRDEKTRLLGIVGAPAGGKTSLAAALRSALQLTGDVVAQDGFHLSARQLDRLGLSEWKGAPDTFDGAGYAHLLTRIAAEQSSGEAIYAPGFDRSLEEPIAAQCLAHSADGIVITEGNYLLLDADPWLLVRRHIDVVWYLHCDTEPREQRLLERHCRFGMPEDAARAWIARSDRPNAERIEAVADRADARLVWNGDAVEWA